jgi:predicted dehydrogenase
MSGVAVDPGPSRLRLGFVGVGMVAELHRAAVLATQHFALAGFHEQDRARAAARSAEWGVPACATLSELLASDVDAVAVLTPASSHPEVAIAALAAGKHVLIEKPVALSAQSVREIQDAADASGRVAMPGHNYAYVPEVTRLIRLVRDGSLGTPRAFWATYAIAHAEEVAAAYPGVLASIMIHNVYLALAALGAPDRISAGVAEPAWLRHQAEDQAWMAWEYAGGCSAHLFASFAVGDDSADPWSFVVKVLGTRGSASATFRSSIFDRPLGSLPFALPAYEESYEHELDAFARAINGRGTLTSTIDDARIALAIIEAGYASAASGRRVDREDVDGGW